MKIGLIFPAASIKNIDRLLNPQQNPLKPYANIPANLEKIHSVNLDDQIKMTIKMHKFEILKFYAQISSIRQNMKNRTIKQWPFIIIILYLYTFSLSLEIISSILNFSLKLLLLLFPSMKFFEIGSDMNLFMHFFQQNFVLMSFLCFLYNFHSNRVEPQKTSHNQNLQFHQPRNELLVPNRKLKQANQRQSQTTEMLPRQISNKFYSQLRCLFCKTSNDDYGSSIFLQSEWQQSIFNDKKYQLKICKEKAGTSPIWFPESVIIIMQSFKELQWRSMDRL